MISVQPELAGSAMSEDRNWLSDPRRFLGTRGASVVVSWGKQAPLNDLLPTLKRSHSSPDDCHPDELAIT